MSTVRVGDRVQVKFEGTVIATDPAGELVVLPDGRLGAERTHVDRCTVITGGRARGEVKAPHELWWIARDEFPDDVAALRIRYLALLREHGYLEHAQAMIDAARVARGDAG